MVTDAAALLVMVNSIQTRISWFGQFLFQSTDEKKKQKHSSVTWIIFKNIAAPEFEIGILTYLTWRLYVRVNDII